MSPTSIYTFINQPPIRKTICIEARLRLLGLGAYNTDLELEVALHKYRLTIHDFFEPVLEISSPLPAVRAHQLDAI